MEVAETTVEVRNRLGLHLRAASNLAQTLKNFSAQVVLFHGTTRADARSVTSLLMLGAGQGTTLRARAEGRDAREALAAVKALFDDGFGEE